MATAEVHHQIAQILHNPTRFLQPLDHAEEGVLKEVTVELVADVGLHSFASFSEFLACRFHFFSEFGLGDALQIARGRARRVT